jgi:hypothetical protein
MPGQVSRGLLASEVLGDAQAPLSRNIVIIAQSVED